MSKTERHATIRRLRGCGANSDGNVEANKKALVAIVFALRRRRDQCVPDT
jgi:hypothetical protein